MSDLTNYFSQQNEIKSLKAEIVRLKIKLDSESQMKSRYRQQANILKKPTRTSDARKLLILKKSGHKIKLKEIAKKCHLSLLSVKQISTIMNKEIDEMFNIPGGLSAENDPANDFDAVTVICDQSGCMNEIVVDKCELALELGTTGGITCYECAEYQPLNHDIISQI